jgi:hypothetical protein
VTEWPLARREGVSAGVPGPKRWHTRGVIVGGAAVATVVLAVLLSGCEGDEAIRDPVAEVQKAARATLSEPSTVMDVRVASRRAEYVVRGRIEPARDRYHGTASFARGGEEAFPTPPIRIVGTGPEAYIGQPDLPGLRRRRCWFDPHLPIGSAPGTASVQESLALVGIATRLLAHATERARIRDDAEGGDGRTRYEAWVDRSAADAAYSHSDELFEAGPRELARELRLPLAVETVNGHVSGMSLELPRFESAAYLRRFRGIESVSVEISLTPADRKLKLRPTRCIAME